MYCMAYACAGKVEHIWVVGGLRPPMHAQGRSNTSGFSSLCALCFAVMITNSFLCPWQGLQLVFILCMPSWPTGCNTRTSR